MATQQSLPVVLAYEDRGSALPGLEILARSLYRHCPDLVLEVYSPLEEVARRLGDLPSVCWIPTRDLLGRGWNAKPLILQRGLEAHERVLWLDTDVVVTGDLVRRVNQYEGGALVVGQEFRGAPALASKLRAQGFGLEVARSIPFAVNSGSILADRSHLGLIRRWSQLLEREDYQAAQNRPAAQRPAAFVGDQDALWALLVSDFAHVPLDYFRIGPDMVIHCGANGFHALDRLRTAIRPSYAFVHMVGRYKPWSFARVPHWRQERTDWFHLVCFELSPYFEGASPYGEALDRPAWLKRRTLPARLLNLCALGNVALRGLPLAVAAWGAEAIGRRPRL